MLSNGGFQELALHKGWRLPDYTVLMEAGPPHKREFTVTCHMEDLTEKGPAAFYAFFVKLTVFVLEFELDVMFWQLWEAPKRRLKRRLRRK